MRMRKKKNGPARLAAVSHLFCEKPDTPITSPEADFGRGGALWLEVGCGKGGFACGMAKKYPEANIYAMERITDVVMLAGGHVPTELEFFERIGLKKLMQGYTGVVMGVSAGTMNCAETVYVQPEEPGESLDPDFARFAPGLGFTRFMLLPHYQKARHYWLDGRRLYKDITCGDSHGHTFIAMVDGTYIYQHAGKAVLCGEAYAISDGRIEQICEREQTLRL